MIKEKYLYDLQEININKPKAKKILFHFFNDLKKIYYSYKKNEKMKLDNNKINQVYYENGFYQNLLYIYENLKTPLLLYPNLKIYKNIYDDTFIYISKEHNRNVNEFLFILDDNHKINLNDKKITYMFAHNLKYYNKHQEFEIQLCNPKKIEFYIIENKNQYQKKTVQKIDYEDLLCHIYHEKNQYTNSFSLKLSNQNNNSILNFNIMYTGNIFFTLECEDCYYSITIDENIILLEQFLMHDHPDNMLFEKEFTKKTENEISKIIDYNEIQKHQYNIELVQLEKDLYLTKEQIDFFNFSILKTKDIFDFVYKMSCLIGNQYNYENIIKETSQIMNLKILKLTNQNSIS